MRLEVALTCLVMACTGKAGNLDGSDAGLDAGTSAAAGGGSALDAGVLGPTIGDFVGLNAFIDDATALLIPVGNVREYHNWSWCEGNGDPGYPGYPGNQDSFALFGGFWDWDRFYGELQDGGVFGYPAVQGGVPWLNAGALPPVKADAGVTDPASYVAHADVMFQFAARYGRVSVADAKLKLAADQKRLSGLATLHYVEDFNEEDAYWVLPGGAPLLAAEAYAAMASADYDGDQGRLGPTLGLKSADPSMQLVMGGLSGGPGNLAAWEHSIELYLDGVRGWSQTHRGGSFPADVINVHHYDFGPDGFGVVNPRPGSSPEADQLTATMRLLRQYRDLHLPGKALWITEFGYDTDPQSNLRAPAIGANAPGIVQGQWLIRSYLALLEAGFDRAFLFMSRDGCAGANCHVQFDTSGIVGPKNDWTPKPAYYFIATLRARLGPFHFVGPVSPSNAAIKIDSLRDEVHHRSAWVLWSPTSSDAKVTGVVLPIGANTGATAVRLVDQQLTGSASSLTVTGGTVTLDVDETPVLVIADD